MARRPVAAGSRVPAWPALAASSAHFALATTAAEVGAGGLVDDQPAVHRPAAGAAGHRGVSPRGRGGPAGERRSSRVRSIWSKRVSAWKPSSGENFRSIRSVTRRRSSARLRPSALHHLGGVDPAERQHEGGGVAQVGRDPHLGDGDRDMREVGIVHVAAGEDLGERAADHLADAQLALARACRRRGVLSLPCAVTSYRGRAKSRAARRSDGGRGRDRGGRRLRPHGPDAGAGRRRDAGRAAERRHRAAGAPLDRPRPRRGDGRRRRSASSSRTTRSRSSPAARRCSTSPRRRRRCCMPSSRRRRG